MLEHFICLFSLILISLPVQTPVATDIAGILGSVISAVPPPKERVYPLCESVKWLTSNRYSCPTMRSGILLHSGRPKPSHTVRDVPSSDAPVMPDSPDQLQATNKLALEYTVPG